jgi:DNA-binding protein H-NS
MVTLKALQEKIAKLQAQAEAVAKKESSAVFGKIRELMEKHGLTPDDIASHFRKPTTGKASSAAKTSAQAGEAKYRNPKTGATWTGHGRAPAWIATVKDRSKFLVAEGSAPAESVATKQAKPGNYARGPQAPKYRDPASGATWSGRGPAPAWLASAKDRNAYLIDKSAATPANAESISASKTAKKSTKSAAVKTTGAKKAAVKKAAAVKSTAKKSVVKTAVAAEKSGPASKKVAAKKANRKPVAAKKTAAKKTSVVETATPTAEHGVGGEAASV